MAKTEAINAGSMSLRMMNLLAWMDANSLVRTHHPEQRKQTRPESGIARFTFDTAWPGSPTKKRPGKPGRSDPQ
jgi:hypothetical protein